jgi:Subunit 17 of Mediator complex
MDEGTSSTTPIPVPANDQPLWKDTKLSLERPYKDAKGAPIRRVYDIDDAGGWVYENPKVYEEQLGVQLQRIFEERGTTIWEDYTPEWIDAEEDEQKEDITEEDESGGEGEGDDGDEAIVTKKKPITTAELQKLREDVIPNLLYVLLEGFYLHPLNVPQPSPHRTHSLTRHPERLPQVCYRSPRRINHS